MRKNAQQTNRLCSCGKPALTTKKNGKIYWKNICSACYSKAYRKKNPDKTKLILKRCKERYHANHDVLKSQLMLHIGQTRCKNCLNADTRVLAFHHRNPKEKHFRIAWALTHNYSLENMKSEVEKCDVLCANCHRIIHATKPTGRNWKIKKELLQHINQLCCSSCKSNDIRILSFHHKDPNSKDFTIAKKQLNTPITTLKQEAEKCMVLCDNCHRILHAELIGLL